MDDKYKWLKQYAKPCFQGKVDSLEKLPNIKYIEEFLNGDYSREKVMDYFMIVHNLRTLRNKNYIHLLIPYNVINTTESSINLSIHEPFFQELPIPLCNISFERRKIKEAEDLGIIKNLEVDDIALVHFQEIVDLCTSKELDKYNYLYATKRILK